MNKTDMKSETIRIDSLSIGYRGKSSVKVVAANYNATINSGELTCLLGANGVGKSTLLRTLSAFQPKISGHIFIQGKDISDYTDSDLSTVISVVLTEKCDVRNMTVTELVGLGRSPYTNFWGTLTKDDRRIVEHSIELVRAGELKDRMVHTLSDGERQKVMIAKALAQETPVIFLDEPTAFLDFPSKVEIMQLLHRLSRETGKSIFFFPADLGGGLGEGCYRYRLLLAQGQNHAADFSGRVVVVVNYQHEKKSARMSAGESSPLRVKFRHYQRLEGDMRLPDGALPQQLEARVWIEGGSQVVASCQKRIGGV